MKVTTVIAPGFKGATIQIKKEVETDSQGRFDDLVTDGDVTVGRMPTEEWRNYIRGRTDNPHTLKQHVTLEASIPGRERVTVITFERTLTNVNPQTGGLLPIPYIPGIKNTVNYTATWTQPKITTRR